MKKYYAVIGTLEVSADKLPDWYLIFAEGWGEIEGEGKFLVDQQAWETIRAKLERRGVEIVFDYEHQSVKGGKAPAAGWGKAWRYTPGVGIEAKVDWTEEGAGYLAKQEYRYFSPVFYVSKKDQRLAGLHSVALTNTPKTNHLKPLLAKLGAQHSTEENTMLKKLLAKLGLGEEATEEQVVAAIDALSGQTTEVIPGAVIAALDLEETDDASVVVASIHALKQAPKGMVSKADFDALQKKIAKQEADGAVTAAIKAGKVTPDMKEWAEEYALRDLAGFSVFVSKAAVVVPITELGGKTRQADEADISGAVLTVAKLMGVTAEDLKTYGGVEQ